VDEQTARHLAGEVIRPSGLLGHLVGRGDWWSDESRLKRGRLAVGRVMGAAYVFLAPVWNLYPALDPGRVQDPLGLAAQSTSSQDTPEDLRALLRDLERAVERAVQVLTKELPDRVSASTVQRERSSPPFARQRKCCVVYHHRSAVEQ
jgi:hypothetical protein